MAPTLVSVTPTQNDTYSNTVPVPVGPCTPGQLLIAQILIKRTVAEGSVGTLVSPTGDTWQAIPNTEWSPQANHRSSLYMRVATSGDNNATYNWSSPGETVTSFVVVSKISSGSVIGSSGNGGPAPSGGGAAVLTALSISPNIADALLLFYGSCGSAVDSWTDPPTGMTHVYEYGSATSGTGPGRSLAAYQQTLSATGATGDRVTTNASNSVWTANLVAIADAATDTTAPAIPTGLTITSVKG
jgi:hypothetical protein